MSTETTAVVIGGGISGLVCAHALRQKGISVLLLERSSRLGGVIDTIEQDGFLFDIGPQSFTADAALLELIEQLGLTSELLQADPHAPRYILYRGRLVAAPLAPPLLIATPLLGARTKWRLVSEPFRHTHPPAGDESMAAFIRRKFGDDLLANLVGPFVSGIYAGDPERLSLPSAFPTMRQAEEQHGSVIRGFLKAQRQRKGQPRPRQSNFRRGLATLIGALATRLGAGVELNAEVTSIRRTEAPREAAAQPSFEISYTAGGAPRTATASAIIVAAPAREAAALLAPIEPALTEPLNRIEYVPVAQVGSGYRLSQIGRAANQPLRGFGFLVPRTEGLRLLGTVWSSSLFPNRAPQPPQAPDAMVSFVSFLGGATDQEIFLRGDDQIAETVHKELAPILNIAGPPAARYITRWKRAIPQYNLGHGQIVAALDKLCATNPGIFLASNYLSGPSLPACISQATKIAESAAALFPRRQ